MSIKLWPRYTTRIMRKKNDRISDDFRVKEPRRSENHFRRKKVYLNVSIVARVRNFDDFGLLTHSGPIEQ